MAGLGAIGMRVAAAIDRGNVPGIRLTAVSASDPVRAAARLARLTAPPPLVPLAERAGVIVECTPARVLAEAMMTMRNIPLSGNPRTGRVAAWSVVATLRRLTATLTAGS